jgi:hypothetical protein
MNSVEEEREASMITHPHRSGSDENPPPADVNSPVVNMHGMPTSSDQLKLVELERENSRLQKLVAELLLKNQQLRRPE